MIHDKIEIRSHNAKRLLLRCTVQEVSTSREERYIATIWDPDLCLEVDQTVVSFETLSGARSHMFQQALDWAVPRHRGWSLHGS